MDEYDDLETYNGDTEHDMWVDFDNYENTGTPDVFDEDNLDDYVDNFNDWDWPMKRFIFFSALVGLLQILANAEIIKAPYFIPTIEVETPVVIDTTWFGR